MNSDTTFNYLVLGLCSILENGPGELFTWGCHSLALAMAHDYPRTQTGLFNLFERPLSDWYPYPIPKQFDRSFGLLYEGELSEEASDYCDRLIERTDLPKSLLAQLSTLENAPFRELFDELKQAYEEGSDAVQREYVLLRRFLIEHPYATGEEIAQTFFRSKYANPKRVGSFYEPISSEGSDGYVWTCDRCGPLRIKHNQLRGLKPSVCSDHRQDLESVRRVKIEPDLRQLKPAIQRRVCIPGVPEIALFQSLEALCIAPSASGLQNVHLYPGVDCYDIRLQFSDNTVWAVDIKDYPNPLKLSDQLSVIYGYGELKYDKGFYVVPQAHIQRRRDYLKLARGNASKNGIQLLGTSTFEKRVKKKIEKLQSKES